jgi:hypothetical protein
MGGSDNDLPSNRYTKNNSIMGGRDTSLFYNNLAGPYANANQNILLSNIQGYSIYKHESQDDEDWNNNQILCETSKNIIESTDNLFDVDLLKNDSLLNCENFAKGEHERSPSVGNEITVLEYRGYGRQENLNLSKVPNEILFQNEANVKKIKQTHNFFQKHHHIHQTWHHETEEDNAGGWGDGSQERSVSYICDRGNSLECRESQRYHNKDYSVITRNRTYDASQASHKNSKKFAERNIPTLKDEIIRYLENDKKNNKKLKNNKSGTNLKHF